MSQLPPPTDARTLDTAVYEDPINGGTEFTSQQFDWIAAVLNWYQSDTTYTGEMLASDWVWTLNLLLLIRKALDAYIATLGG